MSIDSVGKSAASRSFQTHNPSPAPPKIMASHRQDTNFPEHFEGAVHCMRNAGLKITSRFPACWYI